MAGYEKKNTEIHTLVGLVSEWAVTFYPDAKSNLAKKSFQNIEVTLPTPLRSRGKRRLLSFEKQQGQKVIDITFYTEAGQWNQQIVEATAKTSSGVAGLALCLQPSAEQKQNTTRFQIQFIAEDSWFAAI